LARSAGVVRFERVGVEGPGNAFGSEVIHLFGGLGPCGQRLQAEVSTQLHQGTDEGLGFG